MGGCACVQVAGSHSSVSPLRALSVPLVGIRGSISKPFSLSLSLSLLSIFVVTELL